ncbi:MAG: diguanylate cyclase [Pseudomonadota bacterium]|nr:diguanylate cyclase [Pseudomonadota bacterium]
MRAIRAVDSLVARLVAFTVVVVLVGGAARYALGGRTVGAAVERVAATRQLALANYVAADIDGKLQLRRRLLEALAREITPVLDQPHELLEDWLAQRADLLPAFSLGLALVPIDGVGTLANFPRDNGREKLSYGDQDWFLGAVQSREFAIGRPRIGRASHQPQVTLAVPVKDASGHVRAVLAGVTALDAPGFLDLVDHDSISGEGYFRLVSPRDRIYVAATEPEQRLRPLPAPGADALQDRAMQGFRGNATTVDADGQTEYVAIAGVPTGGWFVEARMPTGAVLAPLYQQLRIALLATVGVGVVVVAFLAIFLRGALRPLRQAAAQMRQMADGHTPLERLPIRRADEVGAIVADFNYLVDKLRASEARLAALAHQDHLTGLPNRRAFLDLAADALREAGRQGRSCGLLFVDIDGFKPINDSHSHLGGDEVLRQFAARLRNSLRDADLVTRFGGDEFMVLLDGVEAGDALATRLDALVQRLSASYSLEGCRVSVGASIGVAMYPRDDQDLDRLVALADAAMYEAKRNGRNQWQLARGMFDVGSAQVLRPVGR